jgi:hypothetical protein
VNEDTTDWWHHAAEYLTDAAIRHALKPDQATAGWLRAHSLSIARRPVDDWVGPPFRDHQNVPPAGNLETAHLSWAIAIVLDLAPGIFTEPECDELNGTLREKGAALCLRWMDRAGHINNWRCILTAGIAVAAAVLDDKKMMSRAAREYELCSDLFQADGSYAESIQYGNYACMGLVLTREALIRRDAGLAGELPMSPWVQKPRWDAQALFYLKPLAKWGSRPRPRTANFNDSGALYRASADVLLHIATRGKESFPKEAGLARWLFDKLYLPCLEAPPHDRASFGFVPDFGFLSVVLLPQAADALSPSSLGLPLLEAFDAGDVYARDAQPDAGGRTVLAARTGGKALRSVAHLHGDQNSFILVHNNERLLVDPGHSCYRNLLHDMETSSAVHNTCTFEISSDAKTSQEQQRIVLQQQGLPRRVLVRSPKGVLMNGAPIEPGARRLVCQRSKNVTVIASECASRYGKPLGEFTRFWFLCGSHVLFVFDSISAEKPIHTTWNWLLNNNDGALNLKLFPPDRLVARRGNSALKLFHLAGGKIGGPFNAHIHDAYHPKPAQLGEGQAGSGLLLRWTAAAPAVRCEGLHAICMDDPGAITGWHFHARGNGASLDMSERGESWELELIKSGDEISQFNITESISGEKHTLIREASHWCMR